MGVGIMRDSSLNGGIYARIHKYLCTHFFCEKKSTKEKKKRGSILVSSP
jgi:hypothetical protein